MDAKSGNLNKFVTRSFRYTLRPQDRHDMRFSLEGQHGEGGIKDTILLNLSETGAGFLVSRGAEVNLGEKIKVEIPVPGGQTIAWWGRVVRLEEYHAGAWGHKPDEFNTDGRFLVGLQFDPLPEGHSRAIRRGIEQSFMQAMRDQQYRNWLYYRTFARTYLFRGFVAVALTAFLIWFLWYFSQDSANYDSVKGAPWGQRFKFF